MIVSLLREGDILIIEKNNNEPFSIQTISSTDDKAIQFALDNSYGDNYVLAVKVLAKKMM